MDNPTEEQRKAHLEDILRVPGVHIQDGLVSIHNHEFLEDPAFVAAYDRGAAAAGRDYGWTWRVHIGLWAASVARNLHGDFVECGVNAGFMSSSIMRHLDWNSLDKAFYLLDTFSGIDERYVSEAERADGILEKNRKFLAAGFYVTDPAVVRDNFKEWERVHIIAGSIPDTLPLVKAERIAFLHIDLNCAPPEVAALEYFWDRLATGAMILLDDYAYWGYRRQKLAMDKFAARASVAIASLPTGQGLIIRP